MSLVLEIEHLAGVAFAAVGPESDAADWPPQPDRIFSALVASWAARGRLEPERRALEWLEAIDAVPDVSASDSEERRAAISFVPPNDSESGRKGDPGVLPARRRRQPRRFPAARPHDPVVRLHWPGAVPDDDTFAALGALARDTSYVGHSASVTRCRFVRGELPTGAPPPQRARTRVYPGRLAELERAFQSGRRPRPGDPVRRAVPQNQGPPHSIFAARWLLLARSEGLPGELPDIRAAALVCRAIRDTLVAAYGTSGAAAPESVSGLAPDGRPSTLPHLAFAPLAFVGFPHADARMMGFALIPPRGADLLDAPPFREALRAVTAWDAERGQRVLAVQAVPARPRGWGFRASLLVTVEDARRSLDPHPYVGPATTFATVTPMVLDRHVHREAPWQGEEERHAQIRSACRIAGLPEPVGLFTSKHSAVEGAPAAWPSGTAPPWTGWRLPPWLASRPLTHAVLRFAEPVEGPILLGAGRYLGLGFCRAIGEGRLP